MLYGRSKLQWWSNGGVCSERTSVAAMVGQTVSGRSNVYGRAKLQVWSRE